MSSTRSPDPVLSPPPGHGVDADPWIGRRLGKYLLVRALGRGGMGAVYEARDEMLDRRVAVKLLTDGAEPGTAATPPGTESSGARRLLAEARRAARLNHPNVVTVHEVDAFEGGYFLVMELIDGHSAQDALAAGGAMPWRQAALVMIEACRGLAAAHRAGLVHRDIKPANLLIARGGTCKLADFGIAKGAIDAGSQTGGLALTATAAGVAVGTPTYMSPEQCRSEEVDERSDVYSLGATFYALLTGRPPYVAETAVQVMFAHCGNPIPDPRDADPDVPEACAAVVRRAMAKRRTDRYGSAEEMLRDLEAAVVGGKTAVAPAVAGPVPVDPVAALAAPDPEACAVTTV
ncbi:MAG TPA: serine/threonine-protein kinase, partial [Humisphaera sp.]